MPSKDKKQFSLWNVYYKNPIFHYTAKVMSKLDAHNKAIWKEFLMTKKQIEALGIKVVLVPLAKDESKNIYWMDYPYDYAGRFGLLTDEEFETPHLLVIIRVDQKGRYFETKDSIFINHNGIKDKLKDQFINLMKSYTWFRWSGKHEDSMSVNLNMTN